jgi:hypothetical protein
MSLTCSDAELECQYGHTASDTSDQDILTLLDSSLGEDSPVATLARQRGFNRFQPRLLSSKNDTDL